MKRIWVKNASAKENMRACFAAEFIAENLFESVKLKITAVTRYIAYLNGEEVGRGPARSGKNHLFIDTIDLSGLLRYGKNYLAVRVWDYGLSTYQTVASEPGLWFEIRQGEKILLESSEEIRAQEDLGVINHIVKRNVNLGFSDYYDARKFNQEWMSQPERTADWEKAQVQKEDSYRKEKRSIHMFHTQLQYPKRIERDQEVDRGTWEISLNTRNAFFPGRKDADETIFSGFLGCELDVPFRMEGMIAFPNRTWNGIIGDFAINGVWYPVSNEKREIPVVLEAGRQFFLMQISGKFDDLYCHIEFCFPEKPIVKGAEGRQFFVIGPTARILSKLDGKDKVYGGLDEYNRMEEHTSFHEKIKSADSLEKLLQSGVELHWIATEDVMEDAYIYSLTRWEKPVHEYPKTEYNLGMLWNNQEITHIQPPEKGQYRRIILDFGDIYAGSPEFTICAPEGTILDLYGFENMYQGEIDYTVGLNNSIRYICRDGWQSYRCMVRMGMRYLVLTVRNQTGDVWIRNLCMRASTYPPTNLGKFCCNDALLNRIWEMCVHTHELCREDSFTDCPTYEQAFWIGDAQLSAAICAYVFGDYDFIRHNLYLATTALDNTPLMNALTPTDWNTSIPMWMMNWILSLQQYLQIRDDQKLERDLYPNVRKVLTYYSGLIREDGAFLINAWNMIDWAPMDIENCAVVTAQQGILARCFEIGAMLAEKNGEEDVAQKFRGFRRKLLEYLDIHLWDSERNMFLDGWMPDRGNSRTVSVQTHTLLYLYDAILDPKKREITRQYLMNIPKQFIREGSPFMLYYLYEVWVQNGQTQQLIENIRTRWGEMLSYDSTTCWEVFPGFYEVSRTRSYCHSWSASPAYFMVKNLLGLCVEPEEKTVKIQIPDTDLLWCRGAFPTRYGVIETEWKKEDGTYMVRIHIPDTMEMQIIGDQEIRIERY